MGKISAFCENCYNNKNGCEGVRFAITSLLILMKKTPTSQYVDVLKGYFRTQNNTMYCDNY